MSESEASILASGQTRFKTLRPLQNKPPDSSIGHLFLNSSIRNRPLKGKSVLSNYNTFTLSDTSSVSQASREVLHSLLETLRDSKIPGPRLIRLREEFNNPIGDGAQCEVFAASDDFESLLEERPSDPLDMHTARTLQACKFVAIKRTKTVDYSSQSDGSSSGGNTTRGLRDQFEFAQRDIMTLCKEPFRRHPNIVKLLAWGLCLDTLEDLKGDTPRIPLLVLERANGNLGEYLQNEIDFESDHRAFATEQCKLCLDIGRGLESIHKMNMTHGDLKPSNILIFQSSSSKYGATAKLCDFGLAIEDKKGEEIFTDYLGTPGWIPPESGETLRSSSLALCDVFAYGLVVWCVATLDLKSPIEGLAPRSLTEHQLYHQAFDRIPHAGILRSGQDTNRILRVLRGSLEVQPLLRERQPWRYLDRTQFPLIADAADPTKGSTSLLAFNILMQAAEWVGAASRNVGTKVQASWVPLFSSCWYICSVSIFTLRWLLVWAASRFSVWGKTVAQLVPSKTVPPRQETYELIVEEYAKTLRRGQSGADPDGTNTIDDALGVTCDIDGIQKRLEDETSSSSLLYKMNDLRNTPDGEHSQNIIYALARLRSRFSLSIWDSGIALGPMKADSGLQIPTKRSIQNKEHLILSPNFVVLALELNVDLQALAWLCRGPVGRHEITSSRRDFLWRTTYEATINPILRAGRIQRIALLLQMGANVEDRVSDIVPITAFGRILRNIVIEDLQESERVEITMRVCRHFRHAAMRSGSLQSRFFFTGELPDEGDLDEDGAFFTTALHEAISAHSYLSVQYLLSLHFPIYVQNREGQTPFQLAESMARSAVKDDDQPSRDLRVKLSQESRVIFDIMKQTASTDTHGWNLPFGWTAKDLSSGRYVFEELHTHSITFKAPTFSLWQERRLTFGFKQLSSMGQSFLIDLVRFIVSDTEAFDEGSSEKRLNFDDAWFHLDIRNTKVGKTDSVEANVPAWLSSVWLKEQMMGLNHLRDEVFIWLRDNYLNLGLVFLPFSLAGSTAGWPNGTITAFSSLTMVSLYSMHRFAVRQMAAYHPKYVKVIVTAVSDSTVDVIVGIVATSHGETSLVECIVIGTICNNILLILGTSFLVAGLRQYESLYNYQAASTRSDLLNLSMAFLLMVYTMDLGLSHPHVGRDDLLAPISYGISVVLVILYILYLFFRYKTHPQLYEDDHWVDDYQPDILDVAGLHATNADARRRDRGSPGDDELLGEDDPRLGYLSASLFALVSSAAMVLFADSVVTHVPLTGATTARFYGLFVVPVCLKAPLHGEVILNAWFGRMEATLVTTTNGALRTMYLLYPMFIFLSRILGYPMNMVFAFDEIMVTALATFILAPITARGSSTFLDGGLLLVLCTIVYLEQYVRTF